MGEFIIETQAIPFDELPKNMQEEFMEEIDEEFEILRTHCGFEINRRVKEGEVAQKILHLTIKLFAKYEIFVTNTIYKTI